MPDAAELAEVLGAGVQLVLKGALLSSSRLVLWGLRFPLLRKAGRGGQACVNLGGESSSAASLHLSGFTGLCLLLKILLWDQLQASLLVI